MDKIMIDAYITLLLNSEDLLSTRIHLYLEQNSDYHPSHSELKISVRDINESLLIGSKLYGIVDHGSIPEEENDPMKEFGRTLAQKYLIEGASLDDFLIILKYVRQAYLSLFDEKSMGASQKSAFSFFTERCFDRFEIGVVNEWVTFSNQKKNIENTPKKTFPSIEQNKYLSIFENLTSPLIFVDEINLILNYNLEASYMFPDIRIGEKVFCWEFETEERKTELIKLYHDFQISNDDLFSAEAYLHTPKGKRYFKIIIKKFQDIDSAFKGALLMFEDLTDIIKINDDLQTAKSNAEEADRLKTAFLANMSHEIRTPMHAIIGFTELLINGNYGQEERKEYLELIRKSSNDLFNIIEDLIDIAKMESKQLKIKYKDCQPYKLLSGLFPVFHDSLRRNGIQEDVQLVLNVNADDRQLHIFMDSERLKQIISNLINNAIKFTDEGFIEYGFNRIGKDQLLFFVRDSGIGIPELMKDKIFDRFYQLEEHQQKNHGGAGLGLAICKNIISLLGGRIWLESNVNEGACFYFQIPLRNVPEKYKVSKEDKNGIIRPNWSNKKILVAEDDKINFVYIKEVLTRCGARIVHAKNGIEAIDIADLDSKIDLILMDIKMPEIDGLEASRYISRAHPEIPIIALTAFAMEGDKPKCIKAGCADYISKPIEKEQLYTIVDKYINIERANPSRDAVKIK